MAPRLGFDNGFEEGGARREGLRPGAPEACPWLEQWGEVEDAAEPPPIFGEAELAAAVAAARREAEAETEAEVRAAMGASQAECLARALERIAAQLEARQAALDHALTQRARASRDVALAQAKALASKALARQPLAEVDAMLHDLVARLESQPRLELHLPPALVERGTALLADAAGHAGYRGELLVGADPTLGPGDARLCWQDGTAERSLAQLEREVTAVVDAWLPPTEARAVPPTDDDLANGDSATP
jgi:flagellar assembly protein FliH